MRMTGGTRLGTPERFDPRSIPACQPILLTGPTASGKSREALRIARISGGVIINADALQVYDCWHVLTARPDRNDQRVARHLLYGHVSHHAVYSVGHWLADVTAILDRQGGERPIIVGGSGLYLDALTRGLAPIPPISPSVRAQASYLLSTGIEQMTEDLVTRDPATARLIDLSNPRRIQRAWEVLQETGLGLSHWHAHAAPRDILPRAVCRLVVTLDPRELNARIDRRARWMVNHGALAECERLLPHWSPARPAAKALGAKELIAHLRGEITLDEAIEAMARATRRYAKRQRTWFRSRMTGWRQIRSTPTA